MNENTLRWFNSLRFRLIASVVAIEVVMLSLLVWNNIFIIHSTHTDRLKDTADSMIQQIANTSGNYMLAVDYASMSDYLLNVVKHRELAYLVILDRDARAVVSLGSLPAVHWPVIDEHPSRVTDGIFDTAQGIQVAGRSMGRVLMGFSLSFMPDAIDKSRYRGISIAATEIILTVLATVFLCVRLMRKLRDLSDAAIQVGTGDYSVMVPADGKDEVGQTALAFNRMVADVSRHTSQLAEAEAKARRLLAENRLLVHASLEVQEAERRHLARELHDELGQCIAAIQADAESIHDLSQGKDRRIEASSSAIMQVSSRIYDVVHSMMQRLRPGILDSLGLVDALSDEISAWQKRSPGTLYTFTCSGELSRLGERVNINIYRIVQECLTNIGKHAAAAQVSIDLSEQAQGVVLKVEDDGLGILPETHTKGLGLIGMRERVESLGGRMAMSSSGGTGVSIEVVIPHASMRVALS